MNEYKNNIKNYKNYKVGLYIEDEKTYMRLEFDSELYDGEVTHNIIPRIDLSTINVVDRNEDNFPYRPDFFIEFHSDLANDTFMLVTDVTPRKEMTVEEIEKELGYKIKIKDRKMI